MGRLESDVSPEFLRWRPVLGSSPRATSARFAGTRESASRIVRPLTEIQEHQPWSSQRLLPRPPVNGANSPNGANRRSYRNRYAYAPRLSAINNAICNAPSPGSDGRQKDRATGWIMKTRTGRRLPRRTTAVTCRDGLPAPPKVDASRTKPALSAVTIRARSVTRRGPKRTCKSSDTSTVAIGSSSPAVPLRVLN